MPKGKVKWFDKKKGYGFIETEYGNSLFVHVSSIQDNGSRELFKGDEVTFEVGKGKKGPVAIRVQTGGKRCNMKRQPV
jgi:CspA family cold shock protein